MELFHHKHKCEKCGVEFKTKEELDEHVKIHAQSEQPSSLDQQPPANEHNEQQAQQKAVEQPQDGSNETAPEQPTQDQENQQ
jgi:hypothetical protein